MEYWNSGMIEEWNNRKEKNRNNGRLNDGIIEKALQNEKY